jgi:CHAT domain-containing protein/Tfp pilus assembly protein PilF
VKHLKKFVTGALAGFLFLLSFFALELFSSQKREPPKGPLDLRLQYNQIFKMAEEFQSNGEFEKSIEFFQKSLDTAKRISDKEKECESLIKLGLLYWNTIKFEKSAEMYIQALSLARELNLKKEQEECRTALEIYRLYTKGKKHRSSGEYLKSIETFQKTIDLTRKSGSREHELKCLRQQSLTYFYMGNFHEFLSLNEAVVAIARSLNHRKDESTGLYNIGYYHMVMDNYSKSLNFYEEALKIAQSTHYNERESACLNNIGVVYAEIGDHDKCLDYYMRAFEIDKKLGKDIHIELNNIGATYRKKGLVSGNKEDFYEALKFLKDSLKLTRKAKDELFEVYVLNNLGSVYSILEKYSDALKYFEAGYKKAEEIQDVEMKGMILNNIGIVHYNLGNYETSTQYYQKAIDLGLEIEGKRILWEAYLEIARSYEKQGLIGEAVDYYKKSISITEDIRSQIKLEELKAKYLGTNRRLVAYQNLINLFVNLHNSKPKNGFDSEAFYYLEKARARAFLDSLELSKIDISRSVDPELLNQEKELMNDITNIYKKILAAELSSEEKTDLEKQLKIKEDELDILKREMRVKNPAYANVKYPEIITLNEAQKRLPNANTVFFEFCLGEENSCAFVITKKDLKVFPLPPKDEIQKQVNEYLSVISDRDNQDFHLGYELFTKLVLPGLNNNIKNIIFIPDDILHFLPFETLITHKARREWLIKDYKIAYIPSISSLREILQHKKANGAKPRNDLLAIGDPSFDSWEKQTDGIDFIKDFYRNDAFHFFRLKYSGLEIDKISSLFRNAKRKIFRRKEANEAQMKKHNLTDYKVIHFATHSLINEIKPERSSIVLSLDDDSTEDGFLQMREIYNLKLNSDLVTLSSCQTGHGRFLKGEGIEGLNRAFFYAGASSVIMTLWAVNDQASYQLMERFYDYLRHSKSIIDSLRKAKLEMIESDILSHPYYWAGFIVTGHANKVIFPNTTNKLLFLVLCLVLVGGIILLSVRKINSHRVSHD